jgi:hypothetical protein
MNISNHVIWQLLAPVFFFRRSHEIAIDYCKILGACIFEEKVVQYFISLLSVREIA